MLRTVESDQLRPGMHIHKLLGPWMQHPFWRSSFTLQAEDILRIQDSAVSQVVIDTDLGLDVAQVTQECLAPEAPPAQSADDASLPSHQVDKNPAEPAGDLAAELQRARKICLDGREMVETMFRDVRLGRTVEPERALPLIEQINASVMRHPNALLSVARLKTADDYTYLHSMAVAALMGALARQLGLAEQQILEASMGGLLHDMGKALSPLQILNKPGRLTEEEMAIMRRHPADGLVLLERAEFTDPAVLDVVLHHHEKIDGTGYPHGLQGDQISQLSRMGAICDVYDALSSNRPYKKGWDPAEALRAMASWKGHFDPLLLQVFIKLLGIYPIGSLVRLDSQKLAVVIEQSPGALLKPRVRAFYSARSRSSVLIHDINLADADCQDKIINVESSAQWGFKDLERLYTA